MVQVQRNKSMKSNNYCLPGRIIRPKLLALGRFELLYQFTCLFRNNFKDSYFCESVLVNFHFVVATLKLACFYLDDFLWPRMF